MKQRLFVSCLLGLVMLSTVGCRRAVSDGFSTGIEDGLAGVTEEVIVTVAENFFIRLIPGGEAG